MAASAFGFTHLKAVMVALYIAALTDVRTLAFSKGELTLESLQKHLSQDTAQLGPTCQKDVLVYLQHLRNGSEWALKMFDSSGKLESGILKGGHTFIGFYSECLEALPDSSVMQKLDEHSPPPPSFTSMYCMSEVRIAPSNRSDEKGILSAFRTKLSCAQLNFSICLPSTCSEDDVSVIANFEFCQHGCDTNATSTICRVRRRPFTRDIPAIVTALFFVMLAIVVGAATLYDYTEGCNKKAPQQCTGLGPLHLNDVRASPADNKAKTAFLCFSLCKNGPKVFGSERKRAGSISVLHGFRFFSIAWIICMHMRRGCLSAFSIVRNPDDMNRSGYIKEIVDQGTLAVVTFLFIGGFLVGYINLKHLRKNNGKRNWFIFYLHRYFRTMPLMMTMVVICALLLHHFGDGPLWEDIIVPYGKSCVSNWWTNLIFLHNFINPGNMCIPHTWYLAADFQLYIISPVFICVLYRWPRAGTAASGALVVAFTAFRIVFVAINGVGSSLGGYSYMHDVYMKPYFRLDTYLAGILLGRYYLDNQETVPSKMWRDCLGWFFCALCLLFATLGEHVLHLAESSVWYAILTAAAPSFWTVSIAWIIYSYKAKCGGIVTKFLSCSIFATLSNLVYAVYIVHKPILLVFFASREESFDYGYFLMGYFFAGSLLLSFAVATVLCLLVEMPMCALDRLFLSGD